MNMNAVGFDFSKFVPGFDFLKQMTQPRSILPSPAQWVAPTVDPEEVERRIQELRTVQFWLEQNTTALKATIQALEVQKMTLTTLKSMNVGLTDMAQVFQQGVADTVSSVTQAVKAAVPEASGQDAASSGPVSAVTWHDVPVQPADTSTAAPEDTAPQEGESPLNSAFAQAGQWWGSMMQTFQSIAQQAQEDVLQRQADFLKAQEEMAQKVAAAMPEAPASMPEDKAAGASGSGTRNATTEAAATAKAAPRATPRRTGKTAAGATAAKAAAAPKAAARSAGAKPAAGSAGMAAKPAAAPRKPAASRAAVAKAPAKPRS